jgi:hypothetical protein
MPDPTTILDYARLRRDNAKLAVAAAQKQVSQARADMASARDEISAATSAFADLEKEAADIRKQLAQVPTPADGNALLDTLEQIIIKLRKKRADTLNAQATAEAAQSAVDQAQAELNRGTARLANAEADLKQAEQSQQRRDQSMSALTVEPLSKINASAETSLHEEPFTSADARIKADIPDKLLARAEERRADEAARIANTRQESLAAEDAALAVLDANGGLEGQAEKRRVVFLRAEAAAIEFVNSAENRFDQAKGTLALISDPRNSALTADQVERITDPNLKAAREAAAEEEKQLDSLLKVVEMQQAALDKAILKAREQDKNPDDDQDVVDANTALKEALLNFNNADTAWRAKLKDRDAKLEAVEARQVALTRATQKAVAANQDPATDAGVIQAKVDLEKAQNEFKSAETDYKESNHGILHAWEAAIPDAMWRLLNDYEEAAATLRALKETSPSKLKDDLENAEKEYVKAKLKVQTSAVVLELLAAAQIQQGARQQSAIQAGANRLFSALRGDK